MTISYYNRYQNYFKFVIIGLFCFWGLVAGNYDAKAQTVDTAQYIPPPSIHRLWNVREKFTYSVKYGFFQIGTVTLELMPDTVYHGKPAHYIRAIIKSNPKIPFVGNKEKIFNSLMVKNDTIPYTNLYWTDDVDDNIPDEDVYRFNYQKGKVYTYKKDQPGDTLSLTEPSICGPVYFYYTRLYAGTGKSVTVPIYINQKKEKIEMDNPHEINEFKSKAFKSGKVKTYTSYGQAYFNGPFGFSGKFKAWYATDSLRIPVAANVKVWLGNVKVRLIKYSIYK